MLSSCVPEDHLNQPMADMASGQLKTLDGVKAALARRDLSERLLTRGAPLVYASIVFR